jgi:type IV secretory pathway VirB4 component
MNIQLPFVGVIIGKAGSGKSTLTKYLLYNQQCKGFYEQFSIVMCFCKTKFNHAYDWLPNQWVHGGYNKKAIKNIMRTQRKIREQNLEPLPVCLIFDDCLNPKDYQSRLFLDLVANRRHYNISIIFSAQYLNREIPTLMRENTDLIFLFKQFSDNSLKGAYNAFGNLSFNDYYEFMRYMKRLKKYQFVKIDTRTESFDDSRHISCTPKDIPTPRVRYLDSIPLEALREI